MSNSLIDLIVDFLPFNVFGFGMDLPSTAISISIILAGVGAVILNNFTGAIGFATMPMNYLALLTGALAGNWLFAGVHLPLDPRLAEPLLFAIAGMSIMGLSMMLMLRRE
jgi:hypothetical protein